MLTKDSLPPRPAWAGSRLDGELERAARVVENPLTGGIPTWTEGIGRTVYDGMVAEFGDPSRAALDARVQPIPPAAGPVVEGVPVDPTPSGALRLLKAETA